MIHKYKFKTEKARIAFIETEIALKVEKVLNGELRIKNSKEQEFVDRGKCLVSHIKRYLETQQKFINAVCLTDDNSDFEESFMNMLFEMERKKYLNIGGIYQNQIYLFGFKKRFKALLA